MTLLLIDTAFDCCQAALWRDGQLIAHEQRVGEARHDVALAPLVASILQQQSLTIADISAIGVTTGPGRFTSLRVGISYARALALPYRTPLYGVMTGDVLRVVAGNAADTAYLVAVKRGEIFAQTETQTEPVNMNLADLPEWLAEQGSTRVLALGAGITTEWQDAIPSILDPQILSIMPMDAIAQCVTGLMATYPQGQTVIRPFYGTSTGVGT
jgi:tRNA threonylcarbamoyl adenosine modification protein YeaZ